jgi:DNA excision repair protein ERCC-2
LKNELKIAARELAEHVLRSGDLVFEFMGSSSPVDAIRAHQRIQKSRPPTYQAEVPISHQVETNRFRLIISGRIDGVYTKPDQVIIEEIKTTARTLDYFQQNENPIHWGQVKIYAYLYATAHRLNEMVTQLTYYQIETGEIREFKRNFSVQELETFFNNLVARYLEWAETIINWCGLRDDSIRNLDFPFPAYRPGQRQMAVEVYRTIRNNAQLLIQAATGIGKTIAAIYPAVKAIAEGLNQKIFYLTARTTGRTVAEKTLDDLRRKGLRLKSLTLTAKDKICFCPDESCNPEECPYARGHYDRIDDALKSIFNRDAFTREVVEKTAKAFRVCPFEFSLELSIWADCIICDYNYAFDPRVFLRRFFQEENGEYTFLIDEAHNLVDRSREMFSAKLFKQPVLDIRRQLKKELPQIYKSLGHINSWLIKARKKCEEMGVTLSETQPPEELFPLLRRFLLIAERWLSLNFKAPFREGLLELFFTMSGFLRVAEQYDESYVTCYEKIDSDLTIKLFCIDPSTHLEKALNRCRSAVFFSATMTPIDYFKKILGCHPSTSHLVLHSPFPRKNLGLFISDRISTYYRHRDRTVPEVSHVIRTLVEQKKGNYLLFFPSYEYMMKIHKSMLADGPQTEIIVQTPGMPEPEREAFLQRFTHENPLTLVGFAVMGGIFGEGIDLVGDRLSGAVVVGVGLPGISLERELIREYFTDTLNTGFEYAYLYPGINRVLQAAGRVIRTESDRGVLLLVDQRYATFQYKSLLPEEWKPIRVQGVHQLAKDLQKFWDKNNSPQTHTETD